MEAFLSGRKQLQQVLIYELRQPSEGKYSIIRGKPETTGPPPGAQVSGFTPHACGAQGLGRSERQVH